MYTAIDCQSFAGGFTLGMVQAGFKLVGKREHTAGFGAPACLANRHLLGYDWELEKSDPGGHGWTPKPVDVVFGNPPCSGFSLASNTNFRGANSPINHCMWDLVQYAGKCDPKVIAFESVQQAVQRQDGREMMQALRARLEEQTGEPWNLTHLKHNALALGGVAYRPRYFWVATRADVGVLSVDPTPLNQVRQPTLWDAIQDLSDLPLDWEPQAYGSAPVSWYVRERSLRSPVATVDGMMTANADSMQAHRIRALFDNIDWQITDTWDDTQRRLYERDGKLPYPWTEAHVERGIRKNWQSGYFPVIRWDPAKPARVITGAGVTNLIHPYLPRQATHREVARIMGFPDDWSCLPWAANRGSDSYWGKGITVQCGSWLGRQFTGFLDGQPLGDHTGELVGDREWLIDIKPAKQPKEAAA